MLMKWIVIVTPVWLMVHLSDQVVVTLYSLILFTMTINISHCLLKMIFVTDSVQDYTFEDMMSCSGSNKPSEFQMIWSILSDRLSSVSEIMPTCITYTPSWGYHFKRWKAKQALYDASNCKISCMHTCVTYIPSHVYHFKISKAKQALYDASKCNTPCKGHNDKYYGIQHELKKEFDPYVDISATYLWSQNDAKSQSTKNNS